LPADRAVSPDVRWYASIFDNLRAIALSPDNSASLIAELAHQTRPPGPLRFDDLDCYVRYQPVLGIGQVQAGELLDTLRPVGDGVGMQPQRACGLLEAPVGGARPRVGAWQAGGP